MTTQKIIVQIDSDLEELIPGFLQHRQDDVVTLRTALGKRDFARLSAIGHDLKGVGGGYGFAEIATIGANIETAAKNQDHAAIDADIAQLSDYLSRVEIDYVE